MEQYKQKEDHYINSSLENLRRMSRTVRDGLCDTCVSKDKPRCLIEDPAEVQDKAKQNYIECLRSLYNKRSFDFKNQEEFSEFLDGIMKKLNSGLSEKLYREHDTTKKGYGVPVAQIKEEMEKFTAFFYDAMKKIKEKRSIEDMQKTAAMAEKLINKDIHPLSDGCSRFSMLLSTYTFMVGDKELPQYLDREKYYAEMNRIDLKTAGYNAYDEKFPETKQFLEFYKHMTQEAISESTKSLNQEINGIKAVMFITEGQSLEGLVKKFADKSGRFTLAEDAEKNHKFVVAIPLKDGKTLNIILDKSEDRWGFEGMMSTALSQIIYSSEGKYIKIEGKQAPAATRFQNSSFVLESELEVESRIYLPIENIKKITEGGKQFLEIMPSKEGMEKRRVEITNNIDDIYEGGRFRLRKKNDKYRISLKIPLFDRDTEFAKTCIRFELKSDMPDGQEFFSHVAKYLANAENLQTQHKDGGKVKIKLGRQEQDFWINLTKDKAWIEFDEERGDPEKIAKTISKELGVPVHFGKSEIKS